MFLYKLDYHEFKRDISDNIKDLFDWPNKLDQILINEERNHNLHKNKLEEDLTKKR